ncbi:MAG: hypothetical protein PVH93_08380 [Nitrosopumilaceae archaeon]
MTNFTKTPYLVLFTILIAITVTSAYALTITLAGNVVITGNTELDGALLDSSNSPGTNGQILSSTTTGVDWITPASSGNLTVIKRESGLTNIGSGQAGSAIANCLEGEIATGGGWQNTSLTGYPVFDFNGPKLTGSVPTGWQVDVFNDGFDSMTIKAFVLCAKLT